MDAQVWPDPDFAERVAAVSKDPAMVKLARSLVRSPDLADDMLQETFYAVVRAPDPAGIVNLRAYFARALRRKSGLTRGGKEIPVENIETAAVARPAERPGVRRPAEQGSVTEARAIHSVRHHAILEKLRAECGTVPARSAAVLRYQQSVADVAGQILMAIAAGPADDEDLSALLIAACPAWFAAAGITANLRQQRLSRGRKDVKALVRRVLASEGLGA